MCDVEASSLRLAGLQLRVLPAKCHFMILKKTTHKNIGLFGETFSPQSRRLISNVVQY